MKCTKCNNHVPDDSVFCTSCGNKLQENQITNTYKQNTYSQYNSTSTDEAGCLAIILSILSPLIGLTLYVIWRDYRPNSAKTCLTVALVFLILNFISLIIFFAKMGASILIALEDLQNVMTFLIP